VTATVTATASASVPPSPTKTLGPDTVPPSVSIRSLTCALDPCQSESPADLVLTLAGIAADTVGVTRVTWRNAATGQTGTATGTANWVASGIVPVEGDNELTITAFDDAGNAGSASTTVTVKAVGDDGSSGGGPSAGGGGGDGGGGGSGGGSNPPSAPTPTPAATGTPPAGGLERAWRTTADARVVVTVPGRAEPVVVDAGTTPSSVTEWCRKDHVHRGYVRLDDVGIVGATFGVELDGTLTWIPPQDAGCVDWSRVGAEVNLPAAVIMQFPLRAPIPGALLWVLDGDSAWRGRLYEVGEDGFARYVTPSRWAANQAHFQEVWKNVMPVSAAQIQAFQQRGHIGPDL
jgi:hypothetical protein